MRYLSGGGGSNKGVSASVGTATAASVPKKVDMTDMLARLCRRPVRLLFVATAQAAQGFTAAAAAAAVSSQQLPIAATTKSSAAATAIASTQAAARPSLIALCPPPASPAAAATAFASAPARMLGGSDTPYASSFSASTMGGLLAAAGPSSKDVAARRLWLQNRAPPFYEGAVCHSWLNKAPGGKKLKTPRTPGGRRRRWAPRYVALHRRPAGGGAGAADVDGSAGGSSGSGVAASSWVISWASKPTATSPSGELHLRHRHAPGAAAAPPPVLLPAAGLRFGWLQHAH